MSHLGISVRDREVDWTNRAEGPVAKVTLRVCVIRHNSWGTDTETVMVTAASEAFGSADLASINRAYDEAEANAYDVAKVILIANPDYMKPARY